MPQILDYSAGYPGAGNIARLGYVGGIRYLKKEGASRVRPLTTSEVLDYSTHRLQLALVYQHVDSARPTQGRAAGRHDADWALTQARAVGIEPRGIYFAVDFDANPASVAEYFRGAVDVLGPGRVGGYGGYRVVAYLLDQGLIRWAWQTVAWSAGRRETRAHLFQRAGQINCNGISCDVNDVLKADFGQHPPPSPQEDDVSTYPDINEQNNCYAAVNNLLLDAAAGTNQHARNALRAILGADAMAATLAELSDDEAHILAAIRNVSTGDIDEQSLAIALGPVLAPLVQAGATPQQVEAAVRRVFASAAQPTQSGPIEGSPA